LWSVIIMIKSNPFEVGSLVIKSTTIVWKGSGLVVSVIGLSGGGL
jgi:hypothetical protein